MEFLADMENIYLVNTALDGNGILYHFAEFQIRYPPLAHVGG